MGGIFLIVFRLTAVSHGVGDVAEELFHLGKGHLVCFENTPQIEEIVLLVNVQRIGLGINGEGLGGQALEQGGTDTVFVVKVHKITYFPERFKIKENSETTCFEVVVWEQNQNPGIKRKNAS